MKTETLFSDAGLNPSATSYSPSEVAKATGVSGETIRAMTRAGTLEHFWVGGSIRIPRAAAIALVRWSHETADGDEVAS